MQSAFRIAIITLSLTACPFFSSADEFEDLLAEYKELKPRFHEVFIRNKDLLNEWRADMTILRSEVERARHEKEIYDKSEQIAFHVQLASETVTQYEPLILRLALENAGNENAYLNQFSNHGFHLNLHLATRVYDSSGTLVSEHQIREFDYDPLFCGMLPFEDAPPAHFSPGNSLRTQRSFLPNRNVDEKSRHAKRPYDPIPPGTYTLETDLYLEWMNPKISERIQFTVLPTDRQPPIINEIITEPAFGIISNYRRAQIDPKKYADALFRYPRSDFAPHIAAALLLYYVDVLPKPTEPNFDVAFEEVMWAADKLFGYKHELADDVFVDIVRRIIETQREIPIETLQRMQLLTDWAVMLDNDATADVTLLYEYLGDRPVDIRDMEYFPRSFERYLRREFSR